MTRFLSAATALVLLLAASTSVSAQDVTVEVTLPSYDYVNLTDLMDIDYTAGDYRLRSSFQDFTVRITDESGADRNVFNVFARAAVTINLANECNTSGPSVADVVTVVQSDVFPVSGGSRTLTSYDFTDDASPIGGQSFDNDEIVQCLEDLVKDQGRATAPVGVYGATIGIFDGSAYEEGEQPEWRSREFSVADCGGTDADGAELLACETATLTIYYTSRSEVVMELAYPGDDDVVANANPTFSWSAGVDDVTLEVYHVPDGDDPGSAVEVAGNLMARVPLPGQSAWTYDESYSAAGASDIRPLEAGEEYAWRVLGTLFSSSGQEEKSSELFSFTVASAGGPASSGGLSGQQAFMNALQALYELTGDTDLENLLEGMTVDLVFIDGQPIGAPGQLVAKINQLQQANREIVVRVEDL